MSPKITKSIPAGRLASPQRIKLVRIIVALAFVCGVILSWRLWTSSRLFPCVPIIASLPQIPFPVDYVLLVTLVGLLIATLIFNSRICVLATLMTLALLATFDQMRWQPWCYQFSFMLAALGLAGKKQTGDKSSQLIINACAVILVSTYFWSGLEKLNAGFIKESWPDFSRPLFHWLLRSGTAPSYIALSIPILEILIAFGLLIRRFRKVSTIVAIGSHAIILVFLVVSGENTVVWPWNIAMGLLVPAVFWQNEEITVRRGLTLKHPTYVVIFVLFAVLPALNFFGVWDSYLSFALYSGNNYEAVILINPSSRDQLPLTLAPYIWHESEPMFLDINRWAYGELNVPVYPEPRVFRRVAQTACELAHHDRGLKLMIKDRPDLLTGHREDESYDCDHLRYLR